MDQKLLGAIVQPLLGWFEKNKRDLPWRRDREPYHVWLSEIMLQQTRVEAVKAYYMRFLEAAPDVETLAALPEDRLLKLWEGLGYYNRARNLQRCAKEIVSRGGVFPRTKAELMQLPGIGDYTAGAIASICFEEPAAAVDGNVLRVCARLMDDDRPVDAPGYKKELDAALSAVYPNGRCGDFTQSLMELGATVCVPNGAPRCGACPLHDLCRARRNGTALKLRLAKGHYDAARYQDALDVYEAIVKDAPKDDPFRDIAVLGCAFSLEGLKKYPEASKAFSDYAADEAKSHDGFRLAAKMGVARCKAQQGDVAGAEADLNALKEATEDEAGKSRIEFMLSILKHYDFSRVDAEALDVFNLPAAGAALPTPAKADEKPAAKPASKDSVLRIFLFIMESITEK